MKVTFIPIIIGAFGTVTKGLKGLEDLEIRGRVEIIQTTILLICESGRLEETCCHSNSSKKQSANAGGKISKRSKNNNKKKIKIWPHSQMGSAEKESV